MKFNSLLVLLIATVGCSPGFKAGTPSTIQSSEALSFEEFQNMEEEALKISKHVVEVSMPYGTVIDPVYESGDPENPGYNVIKHYTRGADAAIWTGHFLAAESYRYAVTKSADALHNVWWCLTNIQRLVDITGTDVLARTILPINDPKADAVASEEEKNGIYTAFERDPSTGEYKQVRWIGNTSRDQYGGVFFGLGAAFNLIPHTDIRLSVKSLVTRMLNRLISDGWFVKMPGEFFSSVTFLTHQYQRSSMLQLGKLVNPSRFSTLYNLNSGVFDTLSFANFMRFEGLDVHNSYYKFNLAHIYSYNLIPNEFNQRKKQRWMEGFNVLRDRVGDHLNAHFNMIERAIKGPYLAREQQTIELLKSWLKRSRRDYTVDLTEKYGGCMIEIGNKKPVPRPKGSEEPEVACTEIPVQERVNSDFLWQRSPYQLLAYGAGFTETAGVDFILPYWMARYYNVFGYDNAEEILPDSKNEYGANQ